MCKSCLGQELKPVQVATTERLDNRKVFGTSGL